MREIYKICDGWGNWSTYEYCPEESGLDDVFRNIETGISLLINSWYFRTMLSDGVAVEVSTFKPSMYLNRHKFNKPHTGEINLGFNPLDVEQDYYLGNR